MKRKIFAALLSLFAVAGIALAENEPLDLKVNDSKRKQERIRKQKLKDSIANSFENFTLGERSHCSGRIGYPFIKKGDSVRIRYVFDRDIVTGISSRYLRGEIPYECLRKGEWIITVRPDSTQWIDFQFKRSLGNVTADGFLVVVIEPEKYDEVKREYDMVKGDYTKKMDFLHKLWSNYSKKSFSEYIREEWGRIRR